VLFGQCQKEIMLKTFKLASRLIITVIAMSTHFAHADDDYKKKSFEDGLKISISPAQNVESVRESERRMEWTEVEAGTYVKRHHMEWKEHVGRTHVTMVPEPATVAMLVAGITVLLVAARRKQHSKAR
jgi:L-ribulose-5-phosphate 3-epimerase UlaE